MPYYYNTTSKTIGTGKKLIYAKSDSGVIMVNNIVYVFGGQPLGTSNNHFQCMQIETSMPSISPSDSSNAPTTSPTTSPSNGPTNNPIKHNEFDKQMKIIFYISNLTVSDALIVDNKDDIESSIIPLIETEYVNVPVGEKYLEYREFEINVNAFEYNKQQNDLHTMIVDSFIAYRAFLI